MEMPVELNRRLGVGMARNYRMGRSGWVALFMLTTLCVAVAPAQTSTNINLNLAIGDQTKHLVKYPRFVANRFCSIPWQCGSGDGQQCRADNQFRDHGSAASHVSARL